MSGLTVIVTGILPL